METNIHTRITWEFHKYHCRKFVGLWIISRLIPYFFHNALRSVDKSYCAEPSTWSGQLKHGTMHYIHTLSCISNAQQEGKQVTSHSAYFLYFCTMYLLSHEYFPAVGANLSEFRYSATRGNLHRTSLLTHTSACFPC